MNGDTASLRLAVVSRELKPSETTFNITVDSPDHSYVLGSGINNFNCAQFLSPSGRVYHQFEKDIHVGRYPFNPELPIWHGQDFNIDPMAGVVMQPQPNGEIWVVDEIYLQSSNTMQVCDELERRYWRHSDNITIYPDPAGNNRQHARGESDLDIFREKGFKRIKYRRKHPPIADRVNAVNRLLMNAKGEVHLKIDKSCKRLIDSLDRLMYKEGTADIDKKSGFDHPTDALGYCIELERPARRVSIGGRSL